MPQKFRCGRLVLARNGVAKKLHLSRGGGTRDCKLSHIDMGFEEIHDKLRDIFALNGTNRVSILYDFQRKKLDTKRYPNFYEYVSKNGLKFNGTLLYLCTTAANERTAKSTSSEQRTTTTTTQSIQNQPQVQQKTLRVEPDSYRSSVVIKIDDDDDDSQHNSSLTNQVPSMNPLAENLRIFLSTSFSNYSFEKSLNEFVDYLRHLVTQYKHENIFLQIFELICDIRGRSSNNLDRLKKEIQIIDDKQIFDDIFDKVEKSSRLVKSLIELNKIKMSHIDPHSIIIDAFNQFHRNFNTLRDQWINNKNNNKQSAFTLSTNHSSSLAPSTSSSVDRTSSTTHSAGRTQSKHHSVDRTPSRSYSTGRVAPISHSNDRAPSINRSFDQTSSTSRPVDLTSPTNRSVDRTSSINRSSDRTSSTRRSIDRISSTNRSVDRTSLTNFSSSSSRSHFESHSRKQPRALSPSPHRSSSLYRRSTEEDKDNNFSLFRNILKSLDYLFNVLNHLRFTSFYQFIKLIVGEIDCCRSTIKLSDYKSLQDAEQMIMSIERRLTNRMNDEYHRASPHKIDQQLEHSYEETLDSIRQLLISFRLYQSQIQQNKRPRTTRWSSPNLPSSVEHMDIESKPIINLNQQDIKIDDDQSSETSHSSLGDEVLMEVAKNAYEHRPNRYK
ncbi:unnamed protein product [Rotaria sp. Silwood2]|nr:unnamed protein product [Rotaria sp. Silwood2]